MSDIAELPPGPDQREGAPHPRVTAQLFGQDHARDIFHQATRAGRLHHAWLLTGPEGVGKATLAYQLAAQIIQGAFDGHLAASAPVRRRIAAGSEPDLLVLSRPWDSERKRYRQAITIDEMRKLSRFLAMRPHGNAGRAVIVDSADEMNISAANAVLKSLEEPPNATVFFLVSHRPGGLLPTIRSRCRVLSCASLATEPLRRALHQAGMEELDAQTQKTISVLCQGSVGQALDLLHSNASALYPALLKTLVAPRLVPHVLLDVARGETLEMRADLLLMLLKTLSHRAMRQAVTGKLSGEEIYNGEAMALKSWLPDLAHAQSLALKLPEIEAQFRHGRSVNLDPAGLILDMLISVKEAQA